MKIPMLFRFSLYGFLKNQQYYDPFLIVAFRYKGLSFFAIGLLVGFRELAINLLEVPSGAVADLCGRRRSMVLSFVAYIISFSIFGLFMISGTSRQAWALFVAMFFFAVGSAFRTGTHKAMILDWLRLQGRESEKTKTYGYTRSWSKYGSALSVIIATALVICTGGAERPRYEYIFFVCIVPYVLGIINFLGYPAELEGRPEHPPSVRNLAAHFGRGLWQVVVDGRLRRVLFEAMGYESTHKVTKDYLQPIIKQMALALPVLVAVADYRRTAVLIGCFYFALYIASGLASRNAHKVATRFRGESRAARMLWAITLAVFVPIAVALWFKVFWLAAVGFVVLALLQNFWRPITITRVDNETDATMGATMLSIEAQAKAVGAMILAPLLGYAVDKLAAAPKEPALWVVGVVGLAVAFLFSLIPTMRPAPAEQQKQGTDS